MTKYRMRVVAEDSVGGLGNTLRVLYFLGDFVTNYTGELNESKVKCNHSNCLTTCLLSSSPTRFRTP